MRTDVDDRLRAEADRFRFRFSCPDCAHFDPQATMCGDGYPIEPHVSARQDLPMLRHLYFCKSFELV